MVSCSMPRPSRCWSDMAGRAARCSRMAAIRCRSRSRLASGSAAPSPIRACSAISAALPMRPKLRMAICGCRSARASVSRARRDSTGSCGNLLPELLASNSGDSCLHILGKQLPGLRIAPGIAQEPNEHVMRQCNALAPIVLKRREIAHRCKNRLKQDVLYIWIKLQQLVGGAVQLRPFLPFSDRVEGAPFLGSLPIILASRFDIPKQSAPNLPNRLLHDRASLRVAREVRAFLDQRSHEIDQLLAKSVQDCVGIAPAAKRREALTDLVTHGSKLAVDSID